MRPPVAVRAAVSRGRRLTALTTRHPCGTTRWAPTGPRSRRSDWAPWACQGCTTRLTRDTCARSGCPRWGGDDPPSSCPSARAATCRSSGRSAVGKLGCRTPNSCIRLQESLTAVQREERRDQPRARRAAASGGRGQVGLRRPARIAWVMSRGRDVATLVGSRTRTQLADALAAEEVELDDDDIAAIEAAVPARSAAWSRHARAQTATLDSER